VIHAVTFDFWDTLFVDDSDEPKRAAAGLPTKVEARAQALTAELRAHHAHLTEEEIRGAWDRANAWARHQWKALHHNPTVSVRVQVAYRELGLRPTPGFGPLVDLIETMEREISPDPIAGVHDALSQLEGRVRLGIISDAIVSPGRTLRGILADHDLLHFFDFCVFSDEVGRSKPHRRVFDAAAEGLGVPLEALVHVGDRESNDVSGPQLVGAKAILFTAAVDRGSASTQADAVCADALALPALVASL